MERERERELVQFMLNLTILSIIYAMFYSICYKYGAVPHLMPYNAAYRKEADRPLTLNQQAPSFCCRRRRQMFEETLDGGDMVHHRRGECHGP